MIETIVYYTVPVMLVVSLFGIFATGIYAVLTEGRAQ